MMKKGFSFVEIMAVLAILGVLLTVVIWSFSSFRDNLLLENSVGDALSLISKARTNTISSYNYTQYGIHLEASRIVFFKGASFSESDPSNEETLIHPLVEIVNISLNNSSSDLVFQRISGETDNYGSVVIRIKSNPSRSKQINIKPTGIIDIQ